MPARECIGEPEQDAIGTIREDPVREPGDRIRVVQHQRATGGNTHQRAGKRCEAAEAQHEEIYSNVEVMPTVALAAQNNAANRSQRALSCAARFIPQLLGKSSGTRVHYGPVTITRLPSPLPGIRGSFGFRIAIAILGVPAAIEPTTPHLYFDSFGFLSGRAEVALIAVAFPQPVSEEVDARLISLLHSRAEEHQL